MTIFSVLWSDRSVPRGGKEADRDDELVLQVSSVYYSSPTLLLGSWHRVMIYRFRWGFLLWMKIYILGGCSDGLERDREYIEPSQKESIYVNRGNSNSNIRCSKLRELFLTRRSPSKRKPAMASVRFYEWIFYFPCLLRVALVNMKLR